MSSSVPFYRPKKRKMVECNERMQEFIGSGPKTQEESTIFKEGVIDKECTANDINFAKYEKTPEGETFKKLAETIRNASGKPLTEEQKTALERRFLLSRGGRKRKSKKRRTSKKRKSLRKRRK